jgi:hypothetical protein
VAAVALASSLRRQRRAPVGRGWRVEGETARGRQRRSGRRTPWLDDELGGGARPRGALGAASSPCRSRRRRLPARLGVEEEEAVVALQAEEVAGT